MGRKIITAALLTVLMLLSSTMITRSVEQPPVNTTTLYLGHDGRFMTNVTTDPVGLMEGGIWEKGCPIVGGPTARTRYWGIFVGVNDSSPLDYPWDDAMDMKRALEDYSGYDPSRNMLHLGGSPPLPGNASWTEVSSSITWAYNCAGDHDVVVFYFSGHGWRNGTFVSNRPPGECAWTPVDEPDGNEEGIVLYGAMGDEEVSDDMLFSAFSIFGSKPGVGLILIFDSCHSGGMVDGAYDLQNLDNPHAILMACNRYETAVEDSDLKHGVYTYYLLMGLNRNFPQSRTVADGTPTVGNNDGITTARELHDYAAFYVTGAYVQNPCLKLSETKNRELISNVYEPLIRFDETQIPGVDLNGNPYYYTSISSFEPHIADLWSVTPDGLSWTFHIRTGVSFHDWVDRFGVVHVGDTVTPEDVQYSFERALVQDMRDSPTWMIYYPLTAVHTGDVWDLNYDGTLDTVEALNAANVLGNLITRDDVARTVTFHLDAFAVSQMNPWPGFPDFDVFWLQTLAQACYIIDKKFAVDYGCWPGSWDVNATYSWAHWRRYPSNDYSPLDKPVPEGSPTQSLPVMCGTGPYRLPPLCSVVMQWRIDRFNNYWRGWPAPGNPAMIDTVIARGILFWKTRETLFLSGEFDYVDVLTADMFDLWGPPPSFTLPSLRFTWTPDVGRVHFERDWLQGWTYNQVLYPTIFAYNHYKTVPSVLGAVDITSASVTKIGGPASNAAYVFHDEMRVGCTSVVPLEGSSAPAVYVYNITVIRNDNNPNVPLLLVEVALSRQSGSRFEYVNCTRVVLAAFQTVTVGLTWYEDGCIETLPASSTGTAWTIGAYSWPIGSNILETVPANNPTTDGSVTSYTGLVGDVNGDGVVDVFDALKLAAAFGTSEGQPEGLFGWNFDANFSPVPDQVTGKQTIDIFDAIMLAGNFGGHMP